MNRLIVGAIAILLVGAFTIGVIYVLDRYVASPPPIVSQKTTTLEEGVRNAPNNLALRLRLAGAYTAAERYDEAVAQFDEVLKAAAKLKPADVVGTLKTAHLGRGDAFRYRGDLDAAKKDYQFVVDVAKDGEFAPVDLELQSAYFQLGAIALTQDRPADAIKALEAALFINKTDADTLHQLGRAYLQSGAPEQAIEPLRSAVLFVPIGWCEPYDSLGETYTALARSDEAAWAVAMAAFCRDDPIDVRSQLEALVDGPAAMDALIGLGLVAEVDGDRSAAAAWYGKAVAIDPDDYTATSGLARVSEGLDQAPPPAPTGPAPTAPGGNG